MVKEITPKADQQAGKTKSKAKNKVRTKAKPKVKKVSAPKKRKAMKKVVAKNKSVAKKSVASKKRKAVKKVVAKRKSAPKKCKAVGGRVAKKKIAVPKKVGEMKTASFGYLIAGIFELVMAVPFLGWMIGIGSFGMMWLVGIIINIIVIVVLINHKRPTYGNIVAVVANLFGVVPILGWFFHLIATVLLFVLFFREENRNR